MSPDDSKGHTMKRLCLATVGLATILLLFVGTGVSGASPAAKVKPGSVWSAEVQGGACEVQTFSRHTWVANIDNDAGTWKKTKHGIKMTWTQGDARGAIFNGTFVKSEDVYSGTLHSDGDVYLETLTPGSDC